MVDYNKIAIADVLKHPRLGIISHQPDFNDKIQDRIRVRDIQGKLNYVLASDCEFPTQEEYDLYWKSFSKGG